MVTSLDKIEERVLLARQIDQKRRDSEGHFLVFCDCAAFGLRFQERELVANALASAAFSTSTDACPFVSTHASVRLKRWRQIT
jgi:hypothetical protein